MNPSKAIITSNSHILAKFEDIIPVNKGIVNEAIDPAVQNAPVMVPFAFGKKDDITVRPSCMTPPAAEKPTTKDIIEQISAVGNKYIVKSAINEIRVQVIKN